MEAFTSYDNCAKDFYGMDQWTWYGSLSQQGSFPISVKQIVGLLQFVQETMIIFSPISNIFLYNHQ